MKSVIVVATLLLSSTAFAAAKIDLPPGGSVNIQAGEAAVVTCQSSQTRVHFCACGGGSGNMGSNTLIRFDFVGERKVDTIVGHYFDSATCQNELKSHPSCR